MFNIVKRRDLMLAGSVTKAEAEKLIDERYSDDFIVVECRSLLTDAFPLQPESSEPRNSRN